MDICPKIELEDFREANYCLGMETTPKHSPQTLTQGQSIVAERVLQLFVMEEGEEFRNPMPYMVENDGLHKSWTPEIVYRETLVSPLYLTVHTRPDICFALDSVSQYIKIPTKYI